MILAIACEAACAAPSDELARAQWLHQTLVLDNQVFLDRDPEQAQGKLALMGEGLYTYFRGTAPQYARDAMQPGSPGYWPSAFETGETSDVALVGDPHPENIGTFARSTGDTVTVELNDFDAATFGPYGFDLRRLALAYWIASEQIRRHHEAAGMTDPERTLDEEDRLAAATAVARGYADEIAAVAGDLRRGWSMTADSPIGDVLAELVGDAVDRGLAREELTDYTRVRDDGQRVMRYGDVQAPRTLEYGDATQRVFEDTLVRPSLEEQAMVEALLERWVDTLEASVAIDPASLRSGAGLKGMGRRLGAGVASYPVSRYYVLLEGPSASPDDDVLVELKQVLDAVPMPGLPRFPAQPFYTNAERVVSMQRRLQSSEQADPWLGWASLGADGYRSRWRTGLQRTLRVGRLAERLADGDYAPDDLIALAEVSGRLLARRHGTAAKLDGEPGAPAIARAIAGDDEGLVDEVAGFVEGYAPQVIADHDALVGLLEAYGTDLGYLRR